MRSQLIIVCFCLSLITLSGCSEKTPVFPEGNTSLTLVAKWISSDSLFSLGGAKVIVTSEYGTAIYFTDSSGILRLTGIPSAVYNFSVRKPFPDDNSIIIAGALLNIEVLSGVAITDTVYAKPMSGMGLCINEIYCSGPINNTFYFYDQFIELYNSSDSVRYLDGILVLRFSSNSISSGFKGPGADEDNDNDIDGVTYCFRFPGSPGGKEYPLLPKSFITLASDATNHKKMASKSIDLSKADWEFYNQFSPDDLNNPSVPNLRNMITDETTDFYINLLSDVIIVAKGTDSVYTDGIDISDIIDGVEYQSTSTASKTLDSRVDRSFILSPPKYSGKSIQRREPGVDTNDGMLDWEILPEPTPGYQ